MEQSKIKTMVVVRPDAYRRLLEASDFMTKSPIAAYVKELQKRIPEVINSTKLSSQEKMTQYSRLIKKLGDLAAAPYEGDLRALAIESNTQAPPGGQAGVQPRIFEPIAETMEEAAMQETIETQTMEQQKPIVRTIGTQMLEPDKPVVRSVGTEMLEPIKQTIETQTKTGLAEPIATQTQYFTPTTPLQQAGVENVSPQYYSPTAKQDEEMDFEPLPKVAAPKSLFKSPKLKLQQKKGVAGKQWIQSPNLASRPKRDVKPPSFYRPY